MTQQEENHARAIEDTLRRTLDERDRLAADLKREQAEKRARDAADGGQYWNDWLAALRSGGHQ